MHVAVEMVQTSNLLVPDTKVPEKAQVPPH